MVTETPTSTTSTWTDECSGCHARIVARYPGDVKLAQWAQGWRSGFCPRCIASLKAVKARPQLGKAPV